MTPEDLPPELMEILPEAYYLPVGDPADGVFDTTRATTSPWDPRSQHGGPPAALLARAVEQLRPDEAMPIARITSDMLGPIPQGRIRVEAEIVRPGKKIEFAAARMFAGENLDRLVVSATVWRKLIATGSTAEQETPAPAPATVGPQPQTYFPGIGEDWGYGNSLELRFVEGGLGQPGASSVWARLRIPLVASEQTAPVQRLAVLADAANGVSAPLAYPDWIFIPSTMTLTVNRPPRTDWMNLTARSYVSDSGSGLTTGEMYDEAGLVASVNQPLLIAPGR